MNVLRLQILILPDTIINRILRKLTFSQLVQLRLVNKRFNSICTKILNRAFLSLKYSLDTIILKVMHEFQCLTINKNITNRSKKVSIIYFHHKIYQILKSELNILYAVCGRYVQYGIYCFTGGLILDHYKKIMSVNLNLICSVAQSWKTYSELTVQLFFLNQDFMDYFEAVIEPTMLKENSWGMCFGTKVVDLLDSCMSSNFHINTIGSDSKCKVTGCYQLLNTTCTSATPPLKIDVTGDGTDLMKYIRNQIRWNNFFYCVDFKYTKKAGRKCRKFCLNTKEGLQIYDNPRTLNEENNMGFDKTFNRWINKPSSTQNISYTIELECSKYCAPMRLTPYIVEASPRKDKMSKNLTFHSVLQHISTYYHFSLNLKVILPSPDNKMSVQNFFNLYHDSENCTLCQNTKELPL